MLRQQRAAARWTARLSIEHLAFTVLLATNLYSLIGLPEFDRDAINLDPSYVSPLNRYFWLGLLAAASPVLLTRWREALSILLASWRLMLLFGYFTLSTGWALDPGTSVRRLILSLVQVALIVILLAGIRRGALMHLAIFIACVCTALGDLATWVVIPDFAMTPEGFAGFQSQKNQTGLIMMYGCLTAGSMFFLWRGWLFRLGVAAVTLLIFVLLVASRSSTSLFVVVMTPIVLPAAMGLARLRTRMVGGVLAAIGISLALSVFLYFAFCAVTGTDAWLPLRGVTFTERTDIWQFVVDEIAKRPWIGAGYSSFWAIDAAVQPSLRHIDWFSTYTLINEGHDGYLDLLATEGVVGLAGGFWVVLHAIKVAFAALRSTPSAATAWASGGLPRPTAMFHMAVLLGLLVHNTMESNFFSNQAPLAVALLLAALDLDKWRATVPPTVLGAGRATQPQDG
jgi:O-antigen ligase